MLLLNFVRLLLLFAAYLSWDALVSYYLFDQVLSGGLLFALLLTAMTTGDWLCEILTDWFSREQES